jgi:hypothetical protein
MKNLLELNIKRWDCVFIISWRSLTTAALTGLYKIYISKKEGYTIDDNPIGNDDGI